MIRPTEIDLSPFMTTPLDVATKRILGNDALGGSSGPGGFSARSVGMKCAYLHYRSVVSPLVKPDAVLERSSDNLEIGSLFHLLLALYYESLIFPPLKPFADKLDWLRDKLLTEGVSALVVNEAYRLYGAYQAFYEDDDIKPLAVEHRVEHEGVSCRYDLILRRGEHTWFMDHKTRSRLDDGATSDWLNDGGLLTQLYLWGALGLDEVYGKLQGILVNVCIKTKTPQFVRPELAPDFVRAMKHAQDLKTWETILKVCEGFKVWPKNRASCVTRYGKCSLFYHCAEE